MSNPEPNYVTAYYRFRERIHSHIGVGPYEPIPTDLRRQWVQEFKNELDAWCEHMEELRHEAERKEAIRKEAMAELLDKARLYAERRQKAYENASIYYREPLWVAWEVENSNEN